MKQYVEKALKLRKWVKVGHHIPGRVRLKYKLGIVAHIANFRSDDIEQAIASISAFKNYKLNSATGSIVIEYDATQIEPKWVDMLFAGSEQDAERACYAIAERLNLNGESE
ncbi:MULTISPECIES: HMA2 domain-containing protein [Vibrio]|uniref:HMA2 domain-containing protein n=1 Tax=Vibrio TaxID=662 RepID=UPI00148D5656|nr:MULTISPECIES: cation transporter [Vibrio]NOH30962.1 cation transporter [Vibrio mediterranei]